MISEEREEEIKQALGQLRWSAVKDFKTMTLAPGFTVHMERSFDLDRPTGISPLVLVLSFVGRVSKRPLRQEFVETKKGRGSQTIWRLSPSGIALYGANIAGIIEGLIKDAESKVTL